MTISTVNERYNLNGRVSRISIVLAQRIALAIDRRRFLRGSARTIGGVLGVILAGEGLQTAFASRASAATIYSCDGANFGVGVGCPSASVYGRPCGPDPCCVGLSSSCNCSDTPGTTYCYPKGHKADCMGYANDYSGGQLSSCWTCYGPIYDCFTGCSCRYITTCCDCATTAGCSADGICISYDIVATKVCPDKPTERFRIPTPAPETSIAFWEHEDWRI
jgi:hypothetical protein